MARTVKLKEYGVITSCPKDVKEAVIPAGVTKIGAEAFRGCASLSSVVIPSSVTEIGYWAFSGCKALASVEIPDSVTAIGEFAFDGCNITELSHPCLTIKGGVAIKDGKVQYCASQAREIVIPAGVTEIGWEAFKDCTSLLSVEIPSSVTEIGDDAFYGCKSLASVEIPSSVTAIGRSAFVWCSSLTSLVIPPSVTEIGDDAFRGCESLASVEFGGTVAQWEAVKGKQGLLKYIPASSVKCADGEWQKPDLWVENGVALKCLDRGAVSVTIPEGVMTIGNKAFEGCTSLASVVIPPSVTAIHWNAFGGCESLSSVEFGGTVAQWEAVEKWGDWHKDVPATSVKCSDGAAVGAARQEAHTGV